MKKLYAPFSLMVLIIICITFAGLASRFFMKANAQSKEQLCQQYSKNQWELNCCMNHTLENMMDCFNQTEPTPAPTETYQPVPKYTPAPQPTEEAPSASFNLQFPQESEVDKKLQGILDPLWGGLARPFDNFTLDWPQVMLDMIQDDKGNDLSQADLTNWPEQTPAVHGEFHVDKLNKGKSMKVKMPNGLPVKEAIFTAGKDLEDATVKFDLIDGKKPELFKKVKDTGYPIEEQKKFEKIGPPNPKKYDMAALLRLQTFNKQQNTIDDPFMQVLFNIEESLSIGKENIEHMFKMLRMFRLEPIPEQWVALPGIKHEDCSENQCGFYMSSPGTSYFAITEEKPSTANMDVTWLIIYLILAFVALIAFILSIVLRKKIASTVVRVILIVLATAFLVFTNYQSVKIINDMIPKDQKQIVPLKHLITLKTTLGDIKFETYDIESPKAVSSFVTLSQSNFYNDNTFFQVEKDYWIKSGDPSGNGTGSPGYLYSDKIDSNSALYKAGYKRGTVAMVNMSSTVPDSNINGSQFYIFLADSPSTPRNFTIIGQVTSGFDVLDKINNLPLGTNDKPNDPPKITSVDVEVSK